MDTSKDVAQEAGAAEPAIETQPPAEVAAAAPAPEPTIEPRLPDAATLEVKAEPVATVAPEVSAQPQAASPATPVRPEPSIRAEQSIRPEPSMRAEPSIRAEPQTVREQRPTPGASAAQGRPNFVRKAPMIAPPTANQARGPKEQAQSSRGGRFALLAASIALAASIGGALGAAGFATASKMMAAKSVAVAAPSNDDIKAEVKALRDTVAQTRTSIKGVGDSVASLRANLDNAGKSTGGQFAKVAEAIGKINETVDRLERTQNEPAARLAKVVETLERLEKRAAGMETTGAVPVQAAAQARPLGQPPQTLQQQQQQIAATAAPEAKQPPQPAIVDGWTLRRVYDGAAFIEGRHGMVEVEPGDNIRGLGRVNEIKRQDGRWVVVTSRGLIVMR